MVSPRGNAICSAGIVILLVLSTAAGLIAGLEKAFSTGPSEGSGPSESRGTINAFDSSVFTEATIGEPSGLDPATNYDTPGSNVLQNVYETLLWYEGNTTTLVPLLATQVPTVANGGISADGLNYTFSIRPGVLFHDNTTLTADDVAFSIQRVLRMHDPIGPSWMLQQVMDDYLANYIGDTVSNYLAQSFDAPWIHNYLVSQSGGLNRMITENDVAAVAALAVTKVSSSQVSFRLTHPYPAFLSITAFNVMDILSRTFVIAHQDINATCLGTGPYMFIGWDYGVSVHLGRWGGYWGTRATIHDIYILVVSDVDTRLAMLQSGAADNIYLPLSYRPQVIGDSRFTVEEGSPTYSLSFFDFNFWVDSTTANSQYGGTIDDEFFQDVHMRRAFADMFNSTAYIGGPGAGNEVQPNGPIPMGMMGYNASTPVYEYDLTAAANELKATHNSATGTSWFVSGFTIPLFFNVGNTARLYACQMIQAALEQISLMPGAGPMTATVTGLDWPSYVSQMYTRHSFMPMAALGWAPDFADPDDYCTPLLDSSRGTYPMYTCYNNTTVDALVASARVELDPVVREQMYNDIQTMAHDDVPYLWLSQPCNFDVFRSWIHGYYFNPMYGHLYYAALTKTVSAGLTVTGSVSPLIGAAPLTVSLSANVSGGTEPYWYYWNFGDGDVLGTYSSQVNHTYYWQGNFTPSLTVNDSLSAVGFWVGPEIVATSGALEADGWVSTTWGQAPLTLSCYGYADGGNPPYTYHWEFGDGSSSEDQYAEHEYVMAGEYVATLTVTDSSDATANWTSETIVVDLGVAGTQSETNGTVPLPVSFTCTPSGGTPPYTYSWSFGTFEGSSTEQNPTHTYMLGNFTDYPMVTVTDSIGNTGTWYGEGIELVTPINVTASASPIFGTAPLNVSFTSSATGGTPPYTYHWIFFGSNLTSYNTSDEQNTTHTYTEAGYSIAALMVNDSAGIGALWYTPILVGNLSFTVTASPMSGDAPLNVSFTCTPLGGTPPYEFIWIFGDYSFSEEQNASHTYNTTGSYTAMLMVHDSAGRSGMWMSSKIVVTGTGVLSVLAMAFPDHGPAPLNVSFYSSVVYGTPPFTYSWDFGDGTHSDEADPSHTYASEGNYSVTLVITDALSNVGTWNTTIEVGAEFTVTGTASPTSGNVGMVVQFTCTPSGGTPPYSYYWEFGDGTYGYGQNTSHYYSSGGARHATVTVTDADYNERTWTSPMITVTGVVSLTCTASPTLGVMPMFVNFTCTPSGGVGPYTFYWDFGDGSFNTVQNPSHKYSWEGTYTVLLTVTDSASHSTQWTTTITVSSSAAIPELSPGLLVPALALVMIALWNMRRTTGGSGDRRT